MKIKRNIAVNIDLKDVEPNPHRRFDTNPLDTARVDKLKSNIEQDTFWSNLQARKHGDKYQLVFGHHRLEALRQLGVETFDIEIVELTDEQMFRRMLDENLDQGGKSRHANEEAILGARALINGLIETSNTAPEFNKKFAMYTGIQRESNAGKFEQLKSDGAGRMLIHAYLENRGIGESEIGHVLEKYDAVRGLTEGTPATEKQVALYEADEMFETTTQAREFRAAIKPLTDDPQEIIEIAEAVCEKPKREIRKAVKKLIHERRAEKETESESDHEREAEKLMRQFEDARDKVNAGANALHKLTRELGNRGVTSLKGPQARKMMKTLDAMQDALAFFNETVSGGDSQARKKDLEAARHAQSAVEQISDEVFKVRRIK